MDTRQLPSARLTHAIAIVLAVCTGPVIQAQQDLAPWVLVVPAANETGNPALDPVGASVAQTIDTSLRILGDFDVRSIPSERIPPDVIDGDPNALEAFAEAETMDYIVFGSVKQGDDDAIVIEAAVWNRGAGAVTVDETRTATSLFDTFTVADELAVSFLSAFSGQRIAFGSLQLRNDGWTDGSYRVLVDGTQVAVNATSVSNVLIGDRTVTVIATNGPSAGDVLLSETVTVMEGARTALAFTFPEPPAAPEPGGDTGAEVAELAEIAPEEEPAAVESTPKPETVPPNPRPWSRNTRTGIARRPIVSYGVATHGLYMPANERVYAAPVPGIPTFLNLGVDLAGGLFLGFEAGAINWTREDYESDSIDDVLGLLSAGGEVRAIVESRTAIRFAAGYRVWERERGPVRIDLVPTARLGFDAWLQSLYIGEDWVSTLQYADGRHDAGLLEAIVGIGVTSRVHVRRLSVVGTLYADINVLAGGAPGEAGDLLFRIDQPETAVTSLAGVDAGVDSGVAVGGAIGVSVSTGGRARR